MQLQCQGVASDRDEPVQLIQSGLHLELAVRATRFERRSLSIWLGLLASAQTADLITTQADTFRGGIEANQVAAFIMQVGGPGSSGC